MVWQWKCVLQYRVTRIRPDLPLVQKNALFYRQISKSFRGPCPRPPLFQRAGSAPASVNIICIEDTIFQPKDDVWYWQMTRGWYLDVFQNFFPVSQSVHYKALIHNDASPSKNPAANPPAMNAFSATKSLTCNVGNIIHLNQSVMRLIPTGNLVDNGVPRWRHF